MSECKWAGSDRPRVLPSRHADDCRSESCSGCLPCLKWHCRVCGIAHADGTCAECLASARSDLHEIARMCASLPSEVEHRGISGEAMFLLGPAADPEARGHLEASVRSGRVPADYLDAADSDVHPLFVALTWQMVWRDALEHDEASDSELTTAVGYLDQQMTYMADYAHVPFEDFARDLRRCASHLERVLHDGEQVERGAPCWGCRKPLTHVYGATEAEDHWVCNNSRCEVESYTSAQYRGWVEEDARNEATKLTAADAALRFTVEPSLDGEGFTLKASTVRVWGSKGDVSKRGVNHHGMTLYDVADIERRIERQMAAREVGGEVA